MIARFICMLLGHQPSYSRWQRIPKWYSRHVSGIRQYRTCDCARCGKNLHIQRTHVEHRLLDV